MLGKAKKFVQHGPYRMHIVPQRHVKRSLGISLDEDLSEQRRHQFEKRSKGCPPRRVELRSSAVALTFRFGQHLLRQGGFSQASGTFDDNNLAMTSSPDTGQPLPCSWLQIAYGTTPAPLNVS